MRDGLDTVVCETVLDRGLILGESSRPIRTSNFYFYIHLFGGPLVQGRALEGRIGRVSHVQDAQSSHSKDESKPMKIIAPTFSHKNYPVTHSARNVIGLVLRCIPIAGV